MDAVVQWNPLMEDIFRQRERWLSFIGSKPEEVRDALTCLRMYKAVGDKFTRATMLADIAAAMERLHMARGKNAGKNAGKNSWKDSLLNIPMDGYSSADVRAHYGEVVALLDAIDAVVQSGYKLSVSYNPANDNFVASLTCRLQGNPNFDKTISGFAMTWDMAVGVVLFKHFVIAGEGNWAEYARQRMYGDIG